MQLVCHICLSLFEVQPYRASTAKYCSASCRQMGNAHTNLEARGNVQRGRGEGRSYIKLNGRHMHRVVMEQKLGRPLQAGEVVHHKDGNKRNNAPENLELLDSQSTHVRLHVPRKGLGVVNKLPCTFPGCSSLQSAKGFCKSHYSKNYLQTRKQEAAI